MNATKILTILRTQIKLPLTKISIQQYRHYKRYILPMYNEIKHRQKIQGEQKPTPRREFLEWNYPAELYAFSKRLNEDFEIDLLRKALIEKSYVHKQIEEQKKVGIETSESNLICNTDMIIQGEALMDRYLTYYLRVALPKFPEEGIQSIKNYLMCEDILGEVSSSIGTSDLILSQEEPPERNNLANVIKALVAALCEGNGIERACLFIRDFILTRLSENDINDFWEIPDPIETVNAICKNENCGEPEPRLVGHEAVTTIEAVYRVGLYLDTKLIGLGAGETVKIAHELAACDVLWRLFGTSENDFVMPFNLQVDINVEVPPNVSLHEWSENKFLSKKERVSAM